MGLVGKFFKHLSEDGLQETAAVTLNFLSPHRIQRRLDHYEGKAPVPVPFYGSEPHADFERADGTPRIACQLHIFYPEDCPELIGNLNEIPYSFDCWISTDTEEKAARIRSAFTGTCRARTTTIEVFANRGRDVAPLLEQLRPHIAAYDYFCHVHSKHSGTVEWGDDWRRYLYWHLFGTQANIAETFEAFESDPRLGIIYPERYPLLGENYIRYWKRYQKDILQLLGDLNVPNPQTSGPVDFPAGTMFWARVSAVHQVFEGQYPSALDFDAEGDQIDSTLAHVIERSWSYLARSNGFHSKKCFNLTAPADAPYTHERVALFVAFNVDGEVEAADEHYLSALSAIATHIIYISNGGLSAQGRATASRYADEVIERDNVGYDFGAWQEVLLSHRTLLTRGSFDELILCNNSCFGPLIPFEHIYSTMDRQYQDDEGSDTYDFWGITAFPASEEHRHHVQSFFLGFHHNVFSSSAFWSFWNNLATPTDRDKAIEDGEEMLSTSLVEAGFTWNVLCPASESYATNIGETTGYTWPYEMTILGMPFVKKKSYKMACSSQIEKLEGFLGSDLLGCR